MKVRLWGILDDDALERRVTFGGRKGRSAARLLAYREAMRERSTRLWFDRDEYCMPWDYPRNFR